MMNQTQKLDLIDRVISAMVTAQLNEMAEQLKNAQAQVDQLQKQYGKGRASRPCGMGV